MKPPEEVKRQSVEQGAYMFGHHRLGYLDDAEAKRTRVSVETTNRSASLSA